MGLWVGVALLCLAGISCICICYPTVLILLGPAATGDVISLMANHRSTKAQAKL